MSEIFFDPIRPVEREYLKGEREIVRSYYGADIEVPDDLLIRRYLYDFYRQVLNKGFILEEDTLEIDIKISNGTGMLEILNEPKKGLFMKGYAIYRGDEALWRFASKYIKQRVDEVIQNRKENE